MKARGFVSNRKDRLWPSDPWLFYR